MDKSKDNPSVTPMGVTAPFAQGSLWAPVTVGQKVRFDPFDGIKGERGDCRRGGRKKPSEWPRSVGDAAAPTARRTPGTATGEGVPDLRGLVVGIVEMVNPKHRMFMVRYGELPTRSCFNFCDIGESVFLGR